MLEENLKHLFGESLFCQLVENKTFSAEYLLDAANDNKW